MKIKGFITVFAFSICCVPHAQATTVEWNLMHSEYSNLSEWGLGPMWDVLGANFDRHVYFQFYVWGDEEALWAESFGDSESMVSIRVRQMSYGDVVNAASMLGDDQTYFYQAEKGKAGMRSDYNISDYSNSYLAMCVETLTKEPYYAYGWVKLEWSESVWPGGPEVVSSAWDADGGPMIVGGGSALTPEPSSALLLLVGGALLALRRRKVL